MKNNENMIGENHCSIRPTKTGKLVAKVEVGSTSRRKFLMLDVADSAVIGIIQRKTKVQYIAVPTRRLVLLTVTFMPKLPQITSCGEGANNTLGLSNSLAKEVSKCFPSAKRLATLWATDTLEKASQP